MASNASDPAAPLGHRIDHGLVVAGMRWNTAFARHHNSMIGEAVGEAPGEALGEAMGGWGA